MKMPIASDGEALSSRNLWIERNDEIISLSYKISPSMTLGSKLREKDLRRRLKGRLNRWSPQKIIDAGEVVTANWRTADLEKAKSAISYVDQMLDAFRKERIIPKIVEELLGIGASERRRWIKDGRLSTSGTGTFKKGMQYLRPDEDKTERPSHGLLSIQKSSLNGGQQMAKRRLTRHLNQSYRTNDGSSSEDQKGTRCGLRSPNPWLSPQL